MAEQMPALGRPPEGRFVEIDLDGIHVHRWYGRKIWFYEAASRKGFWLPISPVMVPKPVMRVLLATLDMPPQVDTDKLSEYPQRPETKD